jgi:hypothetical protein
MWIAAARTAGDAGIASELVLQPTDVGVLWRKLNGMLGACHLFFFCCRQGTTVYACPK